jgi:hypothetical protein
MSSLVVTHPVNHTCSNSFKARLCRVMTASPTSRHEKLLAGGVSFAETTAKSRSLLSKF